MVGPMEQQLDERSPWPDALLEVLGLIFFSLTDKAFYRLPFPAGGGASACFCRSSDGGWLAVAHRDRGNFLFNPFTGDTLPLPHQRTITRMYYGREDDYRRSEYYPARYQPEPYIRKAVFSCPPSVDDPSRCVVVAIADSGELFFCRPGQSSWSRQRILEGEAHSQFDDIAFYQGRLFGLTPRSGPWSANHDDMVVFDNLEEGDTCELVLVQSRSAHDVWNPLVGVMRRYLVESRGWLLVVERYAHREKCRDQLTAMFKVFGRGYVMLEHRSRTPMEVWLQLDDLDGEVLFVGGSASRSFAAAEYAGGEDEADCIYFTDDHNGEANIHSCIVMRDRLERLDDDLMQNEPCTDIGRYDMSDGSWSVLPPRLPSNERLLPPTWFYLSGQGT